MENELGLSNPTAYKLRQSPFVMAEYIEYVPRNLKMQCMYIQGNAQ